MARPNCARRGVLVEGDGGADRLRRERPPRVHDAVVVQHDRVRLERLALRRRQLLAAALVRLRRAEAAEAPERAAAVAAVVVHVLLELGLTAGEVDVERHPRARRRPFEVGAERVGGVDRAGDDARAPKVGLGHDADRRGRRVELVRDMRRAGVRVRRRRARVDRLLPRRARARAHRRRQRAGLALRRHQRGRRRVRHPALGHRPDGRHPEGPRLGVERRGAHRRDARGGEGDAARRDGRGGHGDAARRDGRGGHGDAARRGDGGDGRDGCGHLHLEGVAGLEAVGHRHLHHLAVRLHSDRLAPHDAVGNIHLHHRRRRRRRRDDGGGHRRRAVGCHRRRTNDGAHDDRHGSGRSGNCGAERRRAGERIPHETPQARSRRSRSSRWFPPLSTRGSARSAS